MPKAPTYVKKIEFILLTKQLKKEIRQMFKAYKEQEEKKERSKKKKKRVSK